MHTNTLFRSAALLLGGAMLFTACKKDDSSEPTNSAKIVATWKKTFDAVDANKNSTLDAAERTSLAAGDYEYLTFNSDGTLRDSLKDGSLKATIPGTWAINGDYLTITVLGFTEAGKLDVLDAGNLIVRDTAENPVEWAGYVK